MTMAKPSLDVETHDHIQALYDHARKLEWIRKYDDRYTRGYDYCESCGQKIWQGENEHIDGCQLAATLKFMETWLSVEDGLWRAARAAQ
jgi:hypothetical protein